MKTVVLEVREPSMQWPGFLGLALRETEKAARISFAPRCSGRCFPRSDGSCSKRSAVPGRCRFVRRRGA